MISAYAHKEQLRQAMRIGCDDFLERSTKLSEREFANAVSEAMMRRRALYPSLRPQKIVHGEMEVDVDGWIATWKGEEIPITTGQFRLLSQLVTHPGKYINYSALHSLSTGEHLPQQEAREMLKTQMRILRAKLRRITGREWIQNKHGVGYRWQWNTVPVDDKDELVDIPEDDL
jgi:two-component system, OmpR family, response regulator